MFTESQIMYAIWQVYTATELARWLLNGPNDWFIAPAGEHAGEPLLTEIRYGKNHPDE